MLERKLKYRWKRTWENRNSDYVAVDGEIDFGRVQLHTSGPERIWTWHLWGDSIEGMPSSVNGSHRDKIDACRQLEAAYEAAKDHGKPVP